ncbi:MAG: hypothetical protein K1X33_05085 [Methanobacteriaceae archaeon]|nr:hypothetical protein [Methanobacteriaceae archaeon]
MVEENVEIDGFLFYAEDITATESYNRRELLRTKILNGSEFVSKGQFIPREYTFTAQVDTPIDRPDVYDEVFEYMNNNPCEVVSRYMGMFNAEIVITKTYNKGQAGILQLSILVREIPDIVVNI